MPDLGVAELFGLIVFLLLAWAFVVIFGRIVNRAGYSRWWLLTMIVPVLNLIMLWVFAFADWPAGRSPSET
ncbi:MAG TPA: hypothetical protein VFR50_16125 [Casimicrobiaceae bacterium]|jgi:hypothetical protein|nr:hypothetical protein [Casimicrobiaceae bacterium]